MEHVSALDGYENSGDLMRVLLVEDDRMIGEATVGRKRQLSQGKPHD
jgi:hypothetical protein